MPKLSFANVGYFLPVLLLAGLTSASLGLLLGTIIKPKQIPAMFPGVLIPMICADGASVTSTAYNLASACKTRGG